ncbi:MAG: type II toxin-antitoxin system HicB family antitoxin [Balneolaceae bacterium]
MSEENKFSFNVRYSPEDQGYIAVCPEFPGLSAFGESVNEAISEAEVALELFIESYNEKQKPLPQPKFKQEFSGQIRARLPKSLHSRLSDLAEEEGVSLNTLMIKLLSEGVGSEQQRRSMAGGINTW